MLRRGIPTPHPFQTSVPQGIRRRPDRRWAARNVWDRARPGIGGDMSTLEEANDLQEPNEATDTFGREVRDSAVLVLLTLAVVLTISFIGLALT